MSAALTIRGQAELLARLVRDERAARSRGSLLGQYGAVLLPLLESVAFALLFGLLLRSRGTPESHLAFIYTGMLAWRMFARGVSAAGTSLSRNALLLRSFPVPAKLVVAAAVGGALLDGLLGAPVLLLILVLRGAALPAPATLLLWGGIALFLHLAVTLGVGFLVAVAGAFYRDVGLGLAPLLAVLMFAAPVVYPRDLVPEPWRLLFLANPVSAAIEAYRAALLGLEPVPAAALATACGVAVGTLLAGHALVVWASQRVRDVL